MRYNCSIISAKSIDDSFETKYAIEPNVSFDEISWDFELVTLWDSVGLYF